MKQISHNYKPRDIRLTDVNAPALNPGGVLVRTSYSVVSACTEGMKVEVNVKESKMSYLGKARARPGLVKKVLQSVQQQGLAAAPALPGSRHLVVQASGIFGGVPGYCVINRITAVRSKELLWSHA